MRGGWHQVAFERDVSAPLTPVERAGRAILLARMGDCIRAFDARCPHRGAHLAHGGTLEGNTVRCPFHGLKVTLGSSEGAQFAAPELPTLVVGGMVFVRAQNEEDRGFERFMTALDEDHYLVPGFEIRVAVDARTVIENAFDALHFQPVHGVLNSPRFTVKRDAEGAIRANGDLDLPPSGWRSDTTRASFEARAFSPYFVASVTGGPRPYTTLTSATPVGARSCIVRLSIAIPNRGEVPAREDCLFLLRHGKEGLEKDRAIWENLDPTTEPHFRPGDEAVADFRAFCQSAIEGARA